MDRPQGRQFLGPKRARSPPPGLPISLRGPGLAIASRGERMRPRSASVRLEAGAPGGKLSGIGRRPSGSGMLKARGAFAFKAIRIAQNLRERLRASSPRPVTASGSASRHVILLPAASSAMYRIWRFRCFLARLQTAVAPPLNTAVVPRGHAVHDHRNDTDDALSSVPRRRSMDMVLFRPPVVFIVRQSLCSVSCFAIQCVAI